MSDVVVHAAAAMGTVVSIQVVGGGSAPARLTLAEQAFAWFREVESALSRFDPGSELRRLTSVVGVPTPVSPMLMAALQFALALAEETDGAFDPTVGRRMVLAGFDTYYVTQRRSTTEVPDEGATWRDIAVDDDAGTVTLHRPMHLDLGAVAKGLAIDLAAKELAPAGDFAIDAGGDLWFGGHNQDGAPWHVGVRHPQASNEVIEALHVSDAAVCTSGSYEKFAGDTHHLLNAQDGKPVRGTASVTVVAPTAMVADGLATAAFLLDPSAGLDLLQRHGIQGMILTPGLERHATAGWPGTPREAAAHGR